MVIRVLNIMIAGSTVINSVSHVARRIFEITGEEIKQPFIKKVMKDAMGMRFKKIPSVSIHINSARCLVLRQ